MFCAFVRSGVTYRLILVVLIRGFCSVFVCGSCCECVLVVGVRVLWDPFVVVVFVFVFSLRCACFVIRSFIVVFVVFVFVVCPVFLLVAFVFVLCVHCVVCVCLLFVVFHFSLF